MHDLDILIPHFRDPDGLAASLDSIRQQSYVGRARVVIVDDGSDRDSFLEMQRRVDSSGLNCTVLLNETNRGRPYTRNRLLDSVDAPYLAWLDAGDLWYPRKIELQFERLDGLIAEGEDLDHFWVTCDYDWHWLGGDTKLVEQKVDVDQLRELMLGKKLRAYLWSILAPTRSFKRLGWFDEQLPRLQDLDMFLRFVSASGTLVKPELDPAQALCVYEKSDIGRDAREIRRCNHRIFDKYAPLYRSYGAEFVRETRLNAEMLSARFAKNNKDLSLFAYYMMRAAAVDPLRAAGKVMSRGFKI